MTASQQHTGAHSRHVGFRPVAGPHTGSSHLSEFDPPQDAEPTPTVAPSAEESSQSTPTVLSKLQKWGDYASVGEPVKPTKFIPMKTPMSREIISNWTLGAGPKHSLTVPELLEWQAARGREVGMIIDLANHECLYEEDIPEWVEYEHVHLVAKVLPPPDAIDTVARIANDFWRQEPDKYIAIHCAYGFNRTGFVVCAYLIQCCGLSVEEAMENFAEARPPGVKHEKFINELYLRYGGREQGGQNGSGAGSSSNGNGKTADSGVGDGAQQERQQRQQRQPGEEDGAGPEAQLPQAAALPPGPPLSRGSSRHGRGSRGSLSGASEQGGGAGSEAAEGCSPPTDASCYIQRVSSRGGISRGSSRGGLSIAVEEAESGHAESRPAGAAAAAAGEEVEKQQQQQQLDDQPSDLQPASNLSAEADHLQSRMAVGRVTSLGLAKALCEDFSMFEGTPVRPSPLQSAMARESAFALAAANTPLDSPISPAGQYWSSDCATPTAQRDGERAEASCSSGGVGTRGPAGGLSGDDNHARAQQQQQQQQQLERGCAGACAPAPGNGPFMAAAAAGGLSRSSSPAMGPDGSSCGGQGQAAAVCGRLLAGRASAPGCSSSGGGSGGTPPPHVHSLPPLPYLTPVTSGVGCSSNRPPISPTSSNAVMDSGGHLGLGRTSQQQQQRGGRFLRSMSVESENQSLGFGARQAIMHLRGEGGSPPPGQQRPLSLMELFNADGSKAGDTGDECDLGYSDYEGSWEDKPSRDGSRAGSYADLAAANPHLAAARGPSGPAAGQQQPQQPAAQQAKQRLPSQQEGRNGTSKCRVM